MSTTDTEGLPKGEMRQPEVPVRGVADEPNAIRHETLRATWREGERWETRVEGSEVWIPVRQLGFGEPTWDNRQEYRRAPTITVDARDLYEVLAAMGGPVCQMNVATQVQRLIHQFNAQLNNTAESS